MSRNLKRISPYLKHNQLDKRRENAFPYLLQVLKCHSQNTDYMIHFVKEPLMKNCSCKEFCNDLFKPVRMSRHVYESVVEFCKHMPIPKHVCIFDEESDVKFMTFDDARKLPCTNEHQSLLATIKCARCF
jgi:hypothetical protein